MTAFLCLASSMSWSGTIYKWTDASGQIHFGDQSPDGVKSEKMSIETGKAEKMANPGGKNDGQSSAAAAPTGSKPEANGQKTGDTTTAEAHRQKNCDLAKKNLQILDNHTRVRIKGKDGKFRYLTSKEIQAKKTEYAKVEKESCKTSASP